MPSPELQQAAERIRAMRNNPPDPNAERPVAPVPADVTATATSAGGVPADWVSVPGTDPSRRMLYMHGGGYSEGSAFRQRRMAADMSRASGCVVLNLDYRLAPASPFPAAVEDATAAFRWMLANGPEGPSPAADTFVAGDSAGGGLALAAMVALRDAGDPLPSAAITMSAWTDLAVTGDTLETRAEADPMITGGRDFVVGKALIYLGTADPRDPLASPLYADLSGLPPLLMQVGDDEMLLDDTLRFAEQARAAGVDVTLHVELGAFHTYQVAVPNAPETHAALEQIGSFVRAHGRIVTGRS